MEIGVHASGNTSNDGLGWDQTEFPHFAEVLGADTCTNGSLFVRQRAEQLFEMLRKLWAIHSFYGHINTKVVASLVYPTASMEVKQNLTVPKKVLDNDGVGVVDSHSQQQLSWWESPTWHEYSFLRTSSGG
jgi:hypothetical protein